MHLSTYLGLLHDGEQTLAGSYRQLGEGHQAEADVYYACLTVAAQCDEHVSALAPVVERYGEAAEQVPERLDVQGLSSVRSGGLGFLRDLHELYALCSFLDITWTMVGQAARGLADAELLQVVGQCESQTSLQLRWLATRMKVAAPQALIVAS